MYHLEMLYLQYLNSLYHQASELLAAHVVQSVFISSLIWQTCHDVHCRCMVTSENRNMS
jgi:hypothetical protein